MLGQLVGNVEKLGQLVGEVHVALGVAPDLRQTVQSVAQSDPQLIHVDAGLGQQSADAAAVLLQQRRHQVHRRNELIVPPDRHGLGIGERQLQPACQFVHSHGFRLRVQDGYLSRWGSARGISIVSGQGDATPSLHRAHSP